MDSRNETETKSFKDSENRIVLIGAGTIGLSFAALHLQYLAEPGQLTIHDTRPDLQEYIQSNLPKYLEAGQKGLISGVNLSTTDAALPNAVSQATIVQEQGPENALFKIKMWSSIEAHAPESALFWSSTSGIAASVQSQGMKDQSRLLVVHPFNPPHIMPLLELVPSPKTKPEHVKNTLDFWRKRGRQPVVLQKETVGFVANRLAFALLREAVHLVNEGVVGIEELDSIVTASMGPRWAIAGPFKSYHAGGGAGGLEWWLKNIGGTVQQCWDDAGKECFGEGDWEARISSRAAEAYGQINAEERDRITRAVLEAVESGQKHDRPG